MPSRATFAAVGGAFVLLAGCAGGPDAEGTEVERAEELLDASTGAIRGLAVDDSLAPLDDAVATLDGSVQTETSAGGRFEFRFVPPGPHVVAVSHPRFEPAALQVDIIPGEVFELRVVMETSAAQAPYHQTLVRSGMVGCAAATSNPTGQGQNTAQLPVCPLVGRTTGQQVVDQGTSFFQVSLLEATGIWGETEWRSNQALGSALNASYFVPLDQARATARDLNRTGGQSPLRLTIAVERIHQIMNQTQTPLCKPAQCSVDVYHSAQPEFPGTGPLKAGVVFQQRFVDHFTVFYRGPLPHAFTALPDG